MNFAMVFDRRKLELCCYYVVNVWRKVYRYDRQTDRRKDRRNCCSRIASHVKMKKRSERRKHCARAGCSKVRTPPAHPLSQTHRQDWLQYTAPQLASAQCNYAVVWNKCSSPHFCLSVTIWLKNIYLRNLKFYFQSSWAYYAGTAVIFVIKSQSAVSWCDYMCERCWLANAIRHVACCISSTFSDPELGRNVIIACN